tara:strand:+ start:11006 stop:12130 length:1125 start_codon:yes stop_codon:yes gene_type:complete
VHIVYFFTYGYSLESWYSAGILNRELKIFEKLIDKYNLKFTFVTYGDEADLNFELNKNIKIIPIYTLIKKSKNNFINILKSLFLSKPLLSKIKNFDVIKQNQLLGSWVSILLKLKSRKPLYTRTGYDMFFFSIKEKKSIFKIILYYLLTQLTLLFSNLYSVTSESDKKFLSRYFIFNKKYLTKRPNWVENKNEREFKKRLSHKILSVGRLEKQKNYKHLIESLAGTNFSLDIVGSGSEKNNIQTLSDKNLISVNFLGIIENEELLQLYTEYKYFVTSSKFEGNPKAVLEAMSSGCIVVANNIPNNNEIISNNKNGILFDESKQTLKDTLIKLDKIDNQEKISLNAIEHTKKYNSLDDLSDNIFLDFSELSKINQ